VRGRAGRAGEGVQGLARPGAGAAEGREGDAPAAAAEHADRHRGLSQAVEAGDYAAFRTALAPYEDGLRVRVGRWIERYPSVQALVGKKIEAVDVAEAVFLAAFDEYEHQPLDERFGDWLESLIDPTVRAFEHNPDEELENVNMARTAVDAGPA